MSLDVKQQVIEEIKASPLFAFQVDKSTDVALCSQLVVFVRYIHEYDIKTKFLFCTSLETTTKSKDVMEKIFTFLIQKAYNGMNYAGYAQMVHQLCLVQGGASKLK